MYRYCSGSFLCPFQNSQDLGIFSVVSCFPYLILLPISICLYFEFSFLSNFCLSQLDAKIWLFSTWTPYCFLKLDCYLIYCIQIEKFDQKRAENNCHKLKTFFKNTPLLELASWELRNPPFVSSQWSHSFMRLGYKCQQRP